MTNRLVLYFLPLGLFVGSWLVVLIIREYSFLTYDSLSVDASGYLFVFGLAFVLGAMLGPFLANAQTNVSRPLYSRADSQKRAFLLAALSIAVSCLLLYKHFYVLGGSLSLSEITDLRLSRGRGESTSPGGSVAGVIGMAFSGFFVVAYLFKVYFHDELSRSTRLLLDSTFVLGLLVSFLSGGRFVSAIALVIAFFSCFLVRTTRLNAQVSVRAKRNMGRKLSIFALIAFVCLVFAQIFIDRAVGTDGDSSAMINVLANNLPGVSLSPASTSILENSPSLTSGIFVFSLLDYYVGHGMHQFDVLYSAEYPSSAPYLGAYQFYLQAILLNRFGFEIISIDQILQEIPNPGVYFTLAGAFYLDFSESGALLVAFLLSLYGSYCWAKFIRRKLFFDMYISLLYLTIIVFSPVVAVTSAGVFPSLMVLIFLIKLFTPRRVVYVRAHE